MDNLLNSKKVIVSGHSIDLAILWISKKFVESKIDINPDLKKNFEDDLRKYIKASSKKIGTGAVVSTFPSFKNIVNGKKTLNQIFSDAGIDTNKVPQFSIVVNKENITVRDGSGSGKVVIEGYDSKTGKFEFGVSKLSYKPKHY